MSAPGRTRRKLAAMMPSLSHSTLGSRHRPRVTYEITCDPSDLWPAQGAWRTNIRLDTYAWEGQADCTTTYWADDGSISQTLHERLSLGSYSTMTDLCRARGLTADGDGELFPMQVTVRGAARLHRDSARSLAHLCRAPLDRGP